MSSEIDLPYPIFRELDGIPLENGYVYVGTTGLNPETDPITVYIDSAQTITIAQPIRTIGGAPVAGGKPVELFIAESIYSLTIRNKTNGLVFTGLAETDSTAPLRADLASSTAGLGASLVSFESGDTVEDLSSTASGLGASLIGIFDTAKKFFYASAVTVEAALAMVVSMTTATKTWYVNPVTGDDSTGTGLVGAPFKTIQKCYDVIPYFIFHQQTIQLADGTYDTNYISAGQSVELPRDAILFGRGKFIAARTQKNGNDLEGGLIIKGNATTPTDVIIEPGDTYSYGIYNAQGQIGLQDFIIKTDVAATSVDNLLTSHRMDSYVHALNVSVDGRSKAVTSRGLVTESGGQMEFTTTTTATIIDNCATLVGTLGPGENITISGQLTLDGADTGIHANKNSKISFAASGLSGQTITNCTTNCITALDGAYVGFTGKDDSDHILVTGPCKIEDNAILSLIWTDIDGAISARAGGVIKFNNSDFQDQLLGEAATFWFSNSNSYISPATANDNAVPVLCRDGTTIHEDGANDFNGSGGAALSARDVTESTIGGDGATITAPNELNAVLRLNAGANRVNCVMAAGRYQWQTVEIFSFAGFSVQIIESTTATISNNSVKLSGLSAADEYQGIKFIWRGTRWYEISRSRAGA